MKTTCFLVLMLGACACGGTTTKAPLTVEEDAAAPVEDAAPAAIEDAADGALACCHFPGAIRCNVPCSDGMCNVDGAVGRCE